MVEVTFVGNDARRLHDGMLRRNQPTRQQWEAADFDPWAWVWDAGSAADAGVPYPYPGFSGMSGFALAPFPHVANTWGLLYYVESPLGSSSYRSFQLVYTRRMSHGFAANVSYNLSKSKGNTDDLFQDHWWTGNVQDVYNLDEAADTVTAMDQTHIFKGLVMLELPFGEGRRWLSGANRVVDAILGGWAISNIFRYNTGNALGISTGVGYSGWDGPVYANVTPNADFSRKFNSKNFDIENLSGNTYFSPGGFSKPDGSAGNRLGNGQIRYDGLRGFGGANEDIGIMKNWRVRETARLQFRAELLNAFNRHGFANPVTSIDDEDFGKVRSVSGSPRAVQFGLRVDW
ncbi:MAG: hypothetical protein ACE15E_03120 [Acidobacteriota bacterium]